MREGGKLKEIEKHDKVVLIKKGISRFVGILVCVALSMKLALDGVDYNKCSFSHVNFTCLFYFCGLKTAHNYFSDERKAGTNIAIILPPPSCQ